MYLKAHVTCSFSCIIQKWRTSQGHTQSRTL